MGALLSLPLLALPSAGTVSFPVTSAPGNRKADRGVSLASSSCLSQRAVVVLQHALWSAALVGNAVTGTMKAALYSIRWCR